MNVLTINPRFLTVEECQCVNWFYCYCRELMEGIEFSLLDLNDQPPIIQEWFDQWIAEECAEYNLHPDDNRNRLWQKFCDVVGR